MSDFTEAFPHLLLMAFLQRVTNGEGGAMDGAVNNAGGVCDSKLRYSNRHGSRFEYEYAAGRGRMDLGVEYKGSWNIIEIKLLRKNRSFKSMREEGIAQILQYRERLNPAASCYLVIFDRRPEKPGWAERISWKSNAGYSDAEKRSFSANQLGGAELQVTVIGC
jgi:hypothetical protein